MTETAPSPFGKGFALIASGADVRARQVALVPGAQAPLLTLDLPAGLRGQAREQVARRQLKDRMDLDENSAEMRPFPPGPLWSKAVIAQTATLQAWRAKIGRRGRAVLPDYLGLPCAQSLWTIAPTPQGLACRLGPQDGFSAPHDLALIMLETRLNAQKERPRALLALGPVVQDIQALAKTHNIPIARSHEELRPLDVGPALTLGHAELTLDLRRDAQLTRARLRRRVLPWRWPLLFGALAAGLWAAGLMIETRALEAETRRISEDTRALAKAHFLPQGPILDIRTQVSRALNDLRTAQGSERDAITAFDLMARASDVLFEQAAAPLEMSAQGQGTPLLELTLSAPDFASAEQLVQALQAEGLSVEVIEMRSQADSAQVRSVLRVSEAAK